MKKLIKFGEKYHLDLVFYIVITFFILVNYYSFYYSKYIGMSLISLGFLIWISGLVTLKDSFKLKAEAKKLVTSGIYSKIRHPIYLGSFLVDVGLAIYVFKTILFRFILAYIILTCIIQYKRILKEERVLLKKFGQRYRGYKSKTWF